MARHQPKPYRLYLRCALRLVVANSTDYLTPRARVDVHCIHGSAQTAVTDHIVLWRRHGLELDDGTNRWEITHVGVNCDLVMLIGASWKMVWAEGQISLTWGRTCLRIRKNRSRKYSHKLMFW